MLTVLFPHVERPCSFVRGVDNRGEFCRIYGSNTPLKMWGGPRDLCVGLYSEFDFVTEVFSAL